MKHESLKGLNEEQIAKVKACKNSDELLALAKQEGIELTDEQLASITYYQLLNECSYFVCKDCGAEWE